MDRADFHAHLDAVRAALSDDDRVIGLVALGSTAATDRQPDEWSDHDLWIVTRDGFAEAVREEAAWLPRPDAIATHFRETVHGRTAVYDDGHVIEYAVFDERELDIARANTSRVLIDRTNIAERMQAITTPAGQVDTAAHTTDDTAGTFVVALIVGVNRWMRGERLSATDLVRGRAVRALVELSASTEQSSVQRDDLDPMRRVEFVAPQFAADVEAAIGLPVPSAAHALLDVAERHVSVIDWSRRAEAVRAVLARVPAAQR